MECKFFFENFKMKVGETMNDIENNIVRQAIQGDHDAFERLVLSYEKKIYNIAYQMFGNEQDAYDASQDIFIKLYKNISSFQFDSAFGTWLHRLAVNTCIDEYRKKKRHNQHNYSIDEKILTDGSDEIERQLPDRSLTPEAIILQQETVDEVQEAIQALKEDFKVVIILRDIRGHTYEEIALMIACELGTVKSRLARARTALKNIILENREQKLTKVVKPIRDS